MKKLLIAIAIALAGANSVALPAYADKPPVYTKPFSKLALGGYDPVAYFTDGKPVKGDAKLTTVHQGAEYRFASAKNLAAFQAAPAKYAPQYGGYCAWAVSQGYTASADPNAWRIVDGKLYLNYNADIQKRWEKDIPGFIKSANSNWPKVLSK